MKNRIYIYLAAAAVLFAAGFIPVSFLVIKNTHVPGIVFLALLAGSFIAAALSTVSAVSRRAKLLRMNESSLVSDLQITAFNDLPMPVAVIEEDGDILKYNELFEDVFLGGNRNTFNINDIFTLDIESLRKNTVVTIIFARHTYRIYGVSYNAGGKKVMLLYFKDDTDYVEMQEKARNIRPCIMLISIDNYSDALQDSKESEKARISAEIEQLLDEYIAAEPNVLILKTANDLFTVVMEEYNLKNIIAGKFRILDEARKLKTSAGNSITLSIGVSFDADTLSESREFAKQSLDMALGRGGDQAAVKSDNGFRFFGGVSKGVEKKSRTKTRVVARALKDLILRSSRVFIMGHAFSDLDSVGSSCGLSGAVKMLGKDAYVVLQRENTLAGALVDAMASADMPVRFIEPKEAVGMIEDDDLLIIVDTHNKKILESYDLYEEAKQIVVIDHHRKVVDYIDNAVIFYHEPFASSASELVTELVQYFELPVNLPSSYANGLLSGIMTDTKNFVMQTGVRTFEAAAFLKKTGADTVTVKGLFADSLSNFQLKSRIVSEAEFCNNCAISTAGSSDQSELKIIASQAADQLLNIKDVYASFVIYKIGDVVNISARSLGIINVQLLMESLGGGGHQTMAAAQLKNVTIEEAKVMLISVIENYERGAE